MTNVFPTIIDVEALPSLGAGVVFLDASVPCDHDASNLAGAICVDLERDLSTPIDAKNGGRHPLPAIAAFCETLGRSGITPNSKVVVYDEQGGALAGARLWWMLRAIGHRSVCLVNGGKPALRNAGVLVKDYKREATRARPYRSAVKDWSTVNIDLVQRIAQDPGWRLIDARAPERFAGEQESIDPVAGHIPGAHNLFWRTLLDDDLRFLPKETVSKRLDEVIGGVPEAQTIMSCGSGVTACQLLLALAYCGRPAAKLYVGSYSEWCRRSLPVASTDG